MTTQHQKPRRTARLVIGGGLLAAFLAFGSTAQASITFQFDYGADTGTGFWDPVSGADRKAAVSTAASSFSSMFGSYFSNSGTILLSASASDDAASNTLASAGSRMLVTSTPGFNDKQIVMTKLQTGVDLNGAGADGTVDVNFGQSWQLNKNASVSGTQYDFYGVMYHEFTHALGFASNIAQDGSPFGGTKGAGVWSPFDKYLVAGNGSRVVSANFSLNQPVWDAASQGGSSMFFDGAFAKAANGGAAVGLYSPRVWEEGSSISHLDTDNPALAGMMMLHAVSTGAAARNYGAIEVGIMRDLGYTVVAVPEPESYAMLLAGLAVIAPIARRRRKV